MLLNNIHIALSVLLHVVVGGAYLAGTWALEHDRVQDNVGGAVVALGSIPIVAESSARTGRQPIILQKREIGHTDGAGQRPAGNAKRIPAEQARRIPPPPGSKAMMKEMLSVREAAPAAALPAVVDVQGAPGTAEEELSSILQAVQADGEKLGHGGMSSKPSKVGYDEKHELAVKIANSIKNKFVRCWTVPAGAKDVESMVVRVSLVLAPSGKVVRAGISDTHLYNSNPFFRAVADSALRAVYKCSPITGLSRDEYNLWKEVVLTFNPRPAL
ncbi:hypothetical protein OC187_02665 [Anaplasma capra]|nr:hypothetical protein [Anaplasma capra]